MLLACETPEKVQEIYALAEQIKKDFYGNRIVMFAPLYLSNYCVNSCTLLSLSCHQQNILPAKNDQGGNPREVIALQDMGHKRLALEAGRIPSTIPLNTYWNLSKPFIPSNTKTAPSAG